MKLPLPKKEELREYLGAKYIIEIEKYLISEGIKNSDDKPYKKSHISQIIAGNKAGTAVLININELLNRKALEGKKMFKKIQAQQNKRKSLFN